LIEREEHRTSKHMPLKCRSMIREAATCSGWVTEVRVSACGGTDDSRGGHLQWGGDRV
jgi:hypothetical protein